MLDLRMTAPKMHSSSTSFCRALALLQIGVCMYVLGSLLQLHMEGLEHTADRAHIERESSSNEMGMLWMSFYYCLSCLENPDMANHLKHWQVKEMHCNTFPVLGWLVFRSCSDLSRTMSLVPR